MVLHLTEYLANTVQRAPARVAVFESDDRQLTYAELDRQSNALAAFLVERGITRGDRVAVVLPKSIEAVVAFFGVLKTGAAYVPVDAHAPAERSGQILADCRVSAAIVHHAAHDAVARARTNGHDIRIVIDQGSPQPAALHHALEHILAEHAAPLSIAHASDDLAYVIYTSGSTGVPKGAQITHANAISYIEWCAKTFQPTEDDRFSAHPPFHFDASVQDIYLTIRLGATMFLIGDHLGKSPRDLARFVARHRVSFWTSTPSSLTLLLQFGQLSDCDMSSLRVVMFGGEVFPVKHLRALKHLWPIATFYNAYGPTETTTTCTLYRIPDVIPADRVDPYPIGQPCDHCQALVLDEDGHEVIDGEPGVLHIAGSSVFAGYWNRPAENAAALSVRNGVRWYRTGDVVRSSPEGFVYLGRNDRMVKRRGYRIELGEIERVLYEHPRVREAATLSIPDADEGIRIAAFVACHDGGALTMIELKTFCATKLPPYMIPDRFIVEAQLPVTSTGKIDYQQLKALDVPRSAAGAA